MAQYTINFSSNASDVIKELDRVISSVARVEKAGSKVVLDLDTSQLTRGINVTFKALDKHINEMQRKLSRLQIGSGAFRSTQAAIGFREGQRERGELIGQPLRLRGQAQSFEKGSLVRLSKELQALQIEASQIKPNSQEWASFQQQIGRIQGELKKADQAAEAIQLRENLGAFSPGSLDQLSARLKLLKIEANAISPSTDRWKAVNAEIQKTEKGIQRISKKPLTAGQRAGAAGGAFLYGGGLGGGAGSALGGIAGGLAGGVPGAFAGAAVGQLTDNLIAQAAAVAKISAEYNKSRIALAGVTSSQTDFNKALDAASSIGQKFLLPITDATKQFTKLQASVRGAGYDTETTVKAFNGISSAIIATGGSTEDLNGALLAVSQVFSKGKVSAEELRQQIGERLAGAFTIFADSSGVAAKELDKLLSKGEVTLDDFIKFLDELNKRYGTTADILASAPENAGPRLAVAIQSMQLAYGGFFQKVGAGFQTYATDLINFAIANQKGFQQVVATVAVAAQDIYNIFSGLIDTLIPPLTSFFKFIFENFARGINALSSLADESRRAAGGPEQRAAASVEALYPNPVERALVGAKAYREALSVELAKDAKGEGAQKTQQQRISEMMKNLFAPFQPSSFGAALGNGGVQGGGGEGGKPAKAPQAGKTRESELPLLALELATQEQIFQIESDIRNARLGGNDLEVIRLQGLQQQLKINQQIAELKLDKVTPADEKAVQLQLLLGKAEKERLDNTFEMESQIMQQYQVIQDAIIGIGTAADMELEGRKQYEALLREGMRPTLAKITTEVNQQFAIEKQKLTLLASQIKDQILVLESKEALTKEDAEQLRILKERLALTQGGVTAIPGLAQGVIEAKVQTAAPKTIESYLGEGLEAAEKRLQELTNTGYQVVEAAGAIGDAFGTAFKGLVSGSMTAQEALAGMFQSIADHFADMVAQMIAEYLKMALIKGLGALIGGIFGGGGGFTPLSNEQATSFNFNPGAMTGGTPWTFFANGGIAPGGFTAFANGGIVTGPTMGLVGEGRYNEAIVPLPDGKSIPVELGGMGGMGGEVTSNIVVNINNGQMQGNGNSNGSELGRKIEGAVKQVLVSELRPGGILSTGRR